MKHLDVYNLGLISYENGLKYQEILYKKCLEKKQNALLVMEHTPTITMGKNSSQDNLLVSTKKLQKENISFIKTDRGGEVTAHVPGQLVAYPILYLKDFSLTVRKYLSLLEDAISSLLSEFHIQTNKDPKNPGVWVKNNKICAVGIRIKKHISTHGIALNVNPKLDIFHQYIIPCGLSARGTTTIAQETKQHPNIPIVIGKWVDIFIKKFSIDAYNVYDRKKLLEIEKETENKGPANHMTSQETSTILDENLLSKTLPACCQSTISSLITHNPMMACHHCKNIIKCFESHEAYENYVLFCHSRKRAISTYRWSHYYVVTFMSYGHFTSL